MSDDRQKDSNPDRPVLAYEPRRGARANPTWDWPRGVRHENRVWSEFVIGLIGGTIFIFALAVPIAGATGGLGLLIVGIAVFVIGVMLTFESKGAGIGVILSLPFAILILFVGCSIILRSGF